MVCWQGSIFAIIVFLGLSVLAVHFGKRRLLRGMASFGYA